MANGCLPNSPQHYAAYTRYRKAIAATETRVMQRAVEAHADLGILALDCGFPVRAIKDRERVTITRQRDLSFQTFRALAEYAPHAKDEDAESAPAQTGDECPVYINRWTARRIYRGHEQIRNVYVEVVNPSVPKPEWRTRARVDEWSDRNRSALVMTLNTFRSGRYVYGFAEEKAMRKLRTLIYPDEYERYLITGAIRLKGGSGVYYLIRKGRPTLAYRVIDSPHEDEQRVVALAALCTHPLGYFDRTWMGAMPPTDEVIAHLLMLRRSEHFFWKKCNQHAFNEFEIGL
jgi:hypothetical protein